MQIIREIRLTALVFGLITAVTPLQAGAANPLLPAAGGDLHPRQISAAPAMALANTSRDTVSFAWAVTDASAAIVSGDSPHEAASRSYRLRVSGAQLASGVTLTTTAPGALVRLHPVDAPRGAMPALQDLEIVKAGRRLRGEQAMDALADAVALRATPLGAQQGTMAFRLSPEVGAGSFTLRSTRALPADGLYAVNVFDRNSDVVLRARSVRDAWFSGETIRTTVSFTAGIGKTELTAFVLAPDGERRTASISVLGDGRFEVSAEAAYASAPGELWEIHASGSAAVDGLVVPRAVKTAFAVTHPSARFNGDAGIADDKGLRIALPVEAAADGRYEARAVLYGTDAGGELRPLANVATARWIATGSAAIVLSIEPELIERSGLGAPFEMRDLRLVDQSRMGTLHRQGRALRIE